MENIKNTLISMLQYFSINSSDGKISLVEKTITFNDVTINQYVINFFQAIEESTIDSNQLKPIVDDDYNNFSIDAFTKTVDKRKTSKIKKWEFNTSYIPSTDFQLYSNEKLFINGQKIAKKNDLLSKFPKDFYLIEEKYQYSKDPGNAPSGIKSAIEIQRLFKALEVVADFVDSRAKTTLYFKTSHKSGHLCSISLDEHTLFDSTNIVLSEDIFKLLKEIENLNIKSSLSDKEKRFIFSSSIAEFVSTKEENNRFKYLLESWEGFNQLFNKNFNIYTDGKSINELKISLAEEQIKLSDNVTKGIIDILSKILILPSLSAIFIVFRQTISNYGHNTTVTVILTFLLAVITISVCLTAYIHLNIIKSLEYSSKFLNKTAKDNLKNDNELTKLQEHSTKMILKTKSLLHVSIWTSIILFIASCWFLIGSMASQKTSHPTKPVVLERPNQSLTQVPK